jgi:hypothetical protein
MNYLEEYSHFLFYTLTVLLFASSVLLVIERRRIGSAVFLDDNGTSLDGIVMAVLIFLGLLTLCFGVLNTEWFDGTWISSAAYVTAYAYLLVFFVCWILFLGWAVWDICKRIVSWSKSPRVGKHC